ncbi:hypothetical protein ACRALDRAFT_2019688 [Sodiomyces alcalophilus JCM 7366]|uniref:uncharacterized protein n=1 Tax=Sodiomyces alcalophilus JCM 7366 TaxID=591952 RepID=UPI0039B60A23
MLWEEQFVQATEMTCFRAIQSRPKTATASYRMLDGFLSFRSKPLAIDDRLDNLSRSGRFPQSTGRGGRDEAKGIIDVDTASPDSHTSCAHGILVSSRNRPRPCHDRPYRRRGVVHGWTGSIVRVEPRRADSTPPHRAHREVKGRFAVAVLYFLQEKGSSVEKTSGEHKLGNAEDQLINIVSEASYSARPPTLGQSNPVQPNPCRVGGLAAYTSAADDSFITNKQLWPAPANRPGPSRNVKNLCLSPPTVLGPPNIEPCARKPPSFLCLLLLLRKFLNGHMKLRVCKGNHGISVKRKMSYLGSSVLFVVVFPYCIASPAVGKSVLTAAPHAAWPPGCYIADLRITWLGINNHSSSSSPRLVDSSNAFSPAGPGPSVCLLHPGTISTYIHISKARNPHSPWPALLVPLGYIMAAPHCLPPRVLPASAHVVSFPFFNSGFLGPVRAQHYVICWYRLQDMGPSRGPTVGSLRQIKTNRRTHYYHYSHSDTMKRPMADRGFPLRRNSHILCNAHAYYEEGKRGIPTHYHRVRQELDHQQPQPSWCGSFNRTHGSTSAKGKKKLGLAQSRLSFNMPTSANIERPHTSGLRSRLVSGLRTRWNEARDRFLVGTRSRDLARTPVIHLSRGKQRKSLTSCPSPTSFPFIIDRGKPIRRHLNISLLILSTTLFNHQPFP